MEIERKDDRLCSQCGYPLKGLPRRGHCPECGNGFNTVTGEGIAHPQNNNITSEKVGLMLRTASIGACLVALITCMGACGIIGHPPKAFWWFFGPITFFVAVLFAQTLYEYFSTRPRG